MQPINGLHAGKETASLAHGGSGYDTYMRLELLEQAFYPLLWQFDIHGRDKKEVPFSQLGQVRQDIGLTSGLAQGTRDLMQ